MKLAIEQFRENLGRARHLSGLYKSLTSTMTEVIDLSDILRAELVLAVSTLDQFIHELVRLGMLEVHRGNRPITEAHSKFEVPLAAVRLSTMNPDDESWFDQAVRNAHGWQTFQRSTQIADAVRLISDVSLWQKVGDDLDQDPKDVKTRLNIIVDRRNKIAHEADINPIFPTTLWPIDETMVDDAVSFISQLCESINNVVGSSE